MGSKVRKLVPAQKAGGESLKSTWKTPSVADFIVEFCRANKKLIFVLFYIDGFLFSFLNNFIGI